MCQIIVSPHFNLSKSLLKSLYQSNSDGLGFAGGGAPAKILPANFKEVWQFYHTHMHGRSGVVHFRMRTDGFCDLERVHPYPILRNKLWLVHNGILNDYRSGPKEAFSDTQKYIIEVLRPMLRRAPTMWKSMEFQQMVGRDIGSGNRFVFVDNHGDYAIINRKQGYEVGNDWYSNGYSFDSHEHFPAVFGASYGWKQSKNWMDDHYSTYKGPYEPNKTTVIGGAGSPNVIPLGNKSRESWDSDEDENSALTPSQLKRRYQLPVLSTGGGLEPVITSSEELAAAIGYMEGTPAFDTVAYDLGVLRQVDAQEYHAIRQEVLAAYKKCASEDELDIVLADLNMCVLDTLGQYGLRTSEQVRDEGDADSIPVGLAEEVEPTFANE